MVDTAAEFLDSLSTSDCVALLRKISGTIRFDVADDPDDVPALVVIDKGEVKVMRENRRADCVVRGNREVLDRVVCGRTGALAAVLRGELMVDGDSELLVLVQRIFPRSGGADGDVVGASARSTR